MEKLKLLSLAAALLGPFTVTAGAQTNAAHPSVVLAQTNSVTATIEDIDYNNREVTLKARDRLMQFKVGDDVQNLAQAKKGDEVKINYYASVALSLRKPGEELPPTGRREAVLARPPGEKPGGIAVGTEDMIATVEDLDRENRKVTLKGPRGNVVTVKVDPEVGDLKRINKGDRIVATCTEALAISVDKAAAAQPGPAPQ